MEYYQTKGELLASTWRSREDVRWVDRQIKNWTVGHNENGYYFVIDILKEEIEYLKWEKKWKQITAKDLEDTAKVIELSSEIDRLKERVKELESDLSFQIKEYDRAIADVEKFQNWIRQAYIYVNEVCKKKITRPDFKEAISLGIDIKWEDNQ